MCDGSQQWLVESGLRMPLLHFRSCHALLCRLAKEKRERLRSAHLAPDYVPLGGAAGLTSNQNAAARLRGDKTDAAVLATGGDSDEERDAEADMRMQFIGRSSTGHAARGSVFAAADAEVRAICGPTGLRFSRKGLASA